VASILPPAHGRKVDVVALPVDIPDHLTPLPYLLDPLPEQGMILRAEVSDWVNIIGFPSGRSSAGHFAIWVKGAIASDMEIDHDQLPCFLSTHVLVPRACGTMSPNDL
jgi:hypothetical protein